MNRNKSDWFRINFNLKLLPGMLPSYLHLQLSYFQNFSSIIFHFHTSYIPHFPSSWSFFRFFFSNVLSSCGFSTLFLPVSFQVSSEVSSLSAGHRIFPIRGQLFNSYFFYQISHFQFSSLLDCFCAFLFQLFTNSYRIFPIRCHLFHSYFFARCHIPSFHLF